MIILAVILSIVVIGGYFLMRYLSKPVPKLVGSEDPEVVAQKILEATNFKAWQNTQYVRWTFRKHHFFWDKKNKHVEVRWSNKRVIFHEEDYKNGLAYINDKPSAPEKVDDLLQKAWEFFCNDSFWLIAPYKIYDPGVERGIVEEEGEKGLMVKYGSGGVTPGDSYLWFTDETGLPNRYKMWVKIIPIGGMEASWEDWITTATGAKFASAHKTAKFTLRLENIATGNSLEQMDFDKDPFSELSQK